MRITNDTLRLAFLGALEQAQQRIARTQEQVATGKRINQPSDDPFAAARIGEIDASIARLDQYVTNAGIARGRLALEEEALAGVLDNLQRVRELAVQGNNATLSNADRAAIAIEIEERLDSIVAIANSTDGTGRFMFAGFSEATQPFAVSGSGFVYNGDDGQRFLQISDERLVAINDSGSAVFQRIDSGNGTFVLAADAGNTGTGVLGLGTVVNAAAFVADTYDINFTTPTDYEIRDSGGALVASGTYGGGQSIAFLGISVELNGGPLAGDSFTVSPSTSQDVFTTVRNLATALQTPASDGASRALMHTEIGQLLVDIDQSIGHIVDVRVEIGARARAVDDEQSLVDGYQFQLTETLSNLQDLDYPEALSLLTQQLFGLEAAQATFARTQNLSLFRFL